MLVGFLGRTALQKANSHQIISYRYKHLAFKKKVSALSVVFPNRPTPIHHQTKVKTFLGEKMGLLVQSFFVVQFNDEEQQNIIYGLFRIATIFHCSLLTPIGNQNWRASNCYRQADGLAENRGGQAMLSTFQLYINQYIFVIMTLEKESNPLLLKLFPFQLTVEGPPSIAISMLHIITRKRGQYLIINSVKIL
jgi:hypothetical protein